MNTETSSLRLPTETVRRVKALAALRGETLSGLTATLLDLVVADLLTREIEGASSAEISAPEVVDALDAALSPTAPFTNTQQSPSADRVIPPFFPAPPDAFQPLCAFHADMSTIKILLNKHE